MFVGPVVSRLRIGPTQRVSAARWGERSREYWPTPPLVPPTRDPASSTGDERDWLRGGVTGSSLRDVRVCVVR